MSGGDAPLVLTDGETYRRNRERIEQMQEYINKANAMNEQGKRNYDQMAIELQKKIQEGEDAQYVSYSGVALCSPT